MPHADSSEVDSSITEPRSVRLEDPTDGKESPDVSEDQSSPRRASTTGPDTHTDTADTPDTPSFLVLLSANAINSDLMA